jgi:hypothetical protein
MTDCSWREEGKGESMLVRICITSIAERANRTAYFDVFGTRMDIVMARAMYPRSISRLHRIWTSRCLKDLATAFLDIVGLAQQARGKYERERLDRANILPTENITLTSLATWKCHTRQNRGAG